MEFQKNNVKEGKEREKGKRKKTKSQKLYKKKYIGTKSITNTKNQK